MMLLLLLLLLLLLFLEEMYIINLIIAISCLLFPFIRNFMSLTKQPILLCKFSLLLCYFNPWFPFPFTLPQSEFKATFLLTLSPRSLSPPSPPDPFARKSNEKTFWILSLFRAKIFWRDDRKPKCRRRNSALRRWRREV